jgi:quercetin dioxygenase-like cupin family protein
MSLFVPSGEGPLARGSRGKTTTFKVTSEASEGRFGLFEHYLPPGSGGASPHFHRTMIEAFYVLEGDLTFSVEGHATQASAGDVLYVPQQAVHGFRVSEARAARILMMFCPALDREQYFCALEALSPSGAPPDQDALLALMHRFDQYPLD